MGLSEVNPMTGLASAFKINGLAWGQNLKLISMSAPWNATAFPGQEPPTDVGGLTAHPETFSTFLSKMGLQKGKLYPFVKNWGSSSSSGSGGANLSKTTSLVTCQPIDPSACDSWPLAAKEVTRGFRQMLGATQPPLLLGVDQTMFVISWRNLDDVTAGLTQVPAEFRRPNSQRYDRILLLASCNAIPVLKKGQKLSGLASTSTCRRFVFSSPLFLCAQKVKLLDAFRPEKPKTSSSWI